jgi:hypothetical protein
MSAATHWEKFLEFEVKNDLFLLEEDGLYIWDILRFHVYLNYMWDNFPDQQARQPMAGLLIKSWKRLIFLIRFLLRPSRPNLFYLHSRDRQPDGRFYDKNANDFLQRLAGESHILETCEAPKMRYQYPVSLFSPANLFNRWHYWFYRRRDHSALVEKINAELGLHWDNRAVNRHISYFKSERLFYKWLFRMKRTKRVYVTYSLPKGLFCAARESGVETVEFQHGIIDRGHLGYHYPPGIRAGGRVYCPDLLLTFSGFWCHDINFPVKQIIPVGNTVLADIEMTGKIPDPDSRVIGFISADVFGHSLAGLAMEYARLHPRDQLLFKLHPNQFSRKKEYCKLLGDYPNVRVITNEQPTEKVILGCDAIVLIQSTIAYQALQAGIPVFIYKRMTYYRHSHIFSSPNVRLIDHARQIILSNQHVAPGPDDIFFEEFDERVYLLLSK